MPKPANILRIPVMIVMLLGLVLQPISAPPSESWLQPSLQQFVTQHPEAVVQVIVQRAADNDQADQLVKASGGVITRDLSMINAFVARIEADALAMVARDSSVNWVSLDAPVLADATGGSAYVTLRSDFDNQAFDDAYSNWGQPWEEIGEDDGAVSGEVAITSFLAGVYQGVRLQGSGKGLASYVDLTGASQAWLSLAYRRKDFAGEHDYVTLELSADSGITWLELDRYGGPAQDVGLLLVQYDLTAYAGNGIQLRLVSNLSPEGTARYYLDYLQVDYTTAQKVGPEYSHATWLPFLATAPAAPTASLLGADAVEALLSSGTMRDEFNQSSYANNDGSAAWAGGWNEDDVLGPGASLGNVTIASSELRLDDYPDTRTQPAASRPIDLSAGVTGAVLSFDFRTGQGVDAYEDRIAVEVSVDGGKTYNGLEIFETISGSVNDSRRYDLTPYISASTAIRFRVANGYGSSGEFFAVDNVQVAYTTSGANTVRDEFNLQSYTNQDGVAPWAGPWIDYDPYGGYGANGGYVSVSGERLNFHYLYAYLENAMRQADLSNSTQASVSFDWETVGLDANESISVLVGTSSFGPFSKLAEYGGTQSGSASFDITPFISSQTTIRFESQSENWEYGENVYIDNIQIAYSTPCPACVDASDLIPAYAPAIGANRLWNELPYLQGQKVSVAVLDSGISAHPDLQNPDGTSRVLTRVNFSSGIDLPDDFYGHGTHVAGIIAGNGAASQGAYIGVAPKANLVDVRVLDDLGRGMMSDVVAGLQWVYENQDAYNIRVVNLSLNSTTPESYLQSPLSAAMEILWFNGIVVVVSAGNNGGLVSGLLSSVLYPPANDPFVITVGASDDHDTPSVVDDTLPSFSAFGITIEGYSKPDLVAPGKNIVSLLASDDSNLVIEHPSHVVVAPNGARYFRMSGTSMATPVVAGAAALLMQDEPGLNPDQVKYRLMVTARPFNAGNSAGALDVYAAVHGSTTEHANTGLRASQLLWSGSDPVSWGSVNWGSVNWGSVNWGSVNWGSVNWGSVNWGSDYWND